MMKQKRGREPSSKSHSCSYCDLDCVYPQMVLEGELTGSYQGDIALDDISVYTGNCIEHQGKTIGLEVNDDAFDAAFHILHEVAKYTVTSE